MRQRELVEKATPIINEIAKQESKKEFAYFTGEDLFQEVWAICLNALKHYSSGLPLENYLRVCVRNRLMNLRRDRYFRPAPMDNSVTSPTQTRINLVNALPLGHNDIEGHTRALCSSNIGIDPLEHVMAKELLVFIEKHLNDSMLSDFRSLRDGSSVPKARKAILQITITKLLEEYNR